MTFYRRFANFIDVQDYFKKVYKRPAQIGLAKCVEALLKSQLCKGEQCSNWGKRPLRLS